jgi:hypothetical protein
MEPGFGAGEQAKRERVPANIAHRRISFFMGCLPFLFWVCSKLLALNLQVVYKKGKTLAFNQRRIRSGRVWSSWAIDVGRLLAYVGCGLGQLSVILFIFVARL